jgi:hypothetical protein
VRLLILAAPLLALASTSAMAQSADPQKRNEWALSMSRCMEDINSYEEEMRPSVTKLCKHFADEEITDSYQNRIRKLLQSGEILAESRTEEVMEHRRFKQNLDNGMHSGQLSFLEIHIRQSILEECLVDPAGLERDDCNRIAGLDRIKELSKIDAEEDDEGRE